LKRVRRTLRNPFGCITLLLRCF